MATHLAAVTPAKGQRFEIQTRPTPKPGPGEILIEVKSIALNPADYIMRDQGIYVSNYPTVIGFDMSGIVKEVGDNVPAQDYKPGITRVAAYSASFWNAWSPDYGAFQKRCLVPWQHATPIPDECNISWNEAATLPVVTQVPLHAWDTMGIPRLGSSQKSDASSELAARTGAEGERVKEALLIWGASASVGTMGVQSARLLREEARSSIAAVYATAGATNHEYITSLGADRVFDYKDPNVVDAIVSAAKKDGLIIRHCFLAMGKLKLCQAVLKAFVGDGLRDGGNNKAIIASAPFVPPDAQQVDGVEPIFLIPAADERERLAQYEYWLGTWLREQLARRTIKPSPELKVVGKDLDTINASLDVLSQGVSCKKLVIEIGK